VVITTLVLQLPQMYASQPSPSQGDELLLDESDVPSHKDCENTNPLDFITAFDDVGICQKLLALFLAQ